MASSSDGRLITSFDDKLIVSLGQYCLQLAKDFDLNQYENELNQHIIDNTPIPYSPYNLRCMLLGYFALSSEPPESDLASIDFVLSDPHLSLYCFHNLYDCESLTDCIHQYTSSRRRYRNRHLPGHSLQLSHDRPFKKPGPKLPSDSED